MKAHELVVRVAAGKGTQPMMPTHGSAALAGRWRIIATLCYILRTWIASMTALGTRACPAIADGTLKSRGSGAGSSRSTKLIQGLDLEQKKRLTGYAFGAVLPEIPPACLGLTPAAHGFELRNKNT